MSLLHKALWASRSINGINTCALFKLYNKQAEQREERHKEGTGTNNLSSTEGVKTRLRKRMREKEEGRKGGKGGQVKLSKKGGRGPLRVEQERNFIN